jgi:hypothetical protein
MRTDMKSKYIPVLKHCMAVLLSVWAIFIMYGISVRSLVTPVLSAALYYLYCKEQECRRQGHSNDSANLMRTPVILSVIFTVCCLLADKDRITGSFSSGLFRIAAVCITGCGVFLMFRALLVILLPAFLKINLLETGLHESGRQEAAEVSDGTAFGRTGQMFKERLICFAVLFICWLPYFLYEYPGIYSPDGIVQMSQVYGLRPYSNHHPVAHTFLMYVCTRFGALFTNSINGQAAFYTMFQLLFHAVVSTETVMTLRTMRIRRWFRIMTMLIFALVPFHAVFGVYAGKDTVYADIFMLFVCILIRLDIVRKKAEAGNKQEFTHTQTILYVAL